MLVRTASVRETLRALATVTLYIFGAASFGTGLALVAEAHAAPMTQEG